MAEAWAGQGMNDKALALLEQGRESYGDIPNLMASYIDPAVARYKLVSTPGAAIKAPVWLNAQAGTTTVEMPGHVTLLEFTAHWCGPCKESYPGVNRLRAKYAAQGFRVVLATRLYGYFETERSLNAEAELARDKTYFASHHLDVPIAVGGEVKVSVVDGKAVYSPGQDPNDTAYRVGGIPQIHLIDKQGRIRLIMVGYDDANEARLAAMIEALLKEK
jgi:thiol-disulfide isomerase/thioredoxin